jgi:hypothetical protein
MNEIAQRPRVEDLESACQQCQGHGGWSSEGEVVTTWRRCGNCNGSGYVPTEYGRRILALIRHNFKPMLEDVTG